MDEAAVVREGVSCCYNGKSRGVVVMRRVLISAVLKPEPEGEKTVRTSNLSRVASAVRKARARNAEDVLLSSSLALAIEVFENAAGALTAFDEAGKLGGLC
jgi:hypothetical protein